MTTRLPEALRRFAVPRPAPAAAPEPATDAEVMTLPADLGRSGPVLLIPSDAVLDRVARMHDLLARWEAVAAKHPVWFALGQALGAADRFQLLRDTAEFLRGRM
jgi:hypothetical protein